MCLNVTLFPAVAYIIFRKERKMVILSRQITPLFRPNDAIYSVARKYISYTCIQISKVYTFSDHLHRIPIFIYKRYTWLRTHVFCKYIWYESLPPSYYCLLILKKKMGSGSDRIGSCCETFFYWLYHWMSIFDARCVI